MIVREIKKNYTATQVANAMFAVGWYWRKPRRRPTNIDIMLGDIPRCDLLKILDVLKHGAP